MTCSCCGRESRIRLKDGKYVSEGATWHYFGEIDVYGCRTSPVMYRLKEGKSFDDDDPFEEVPNKAYDPEIKPRLVEIWECKKCFEEESADE